MAIVIMVQRTPKTYHVNESSLLFADTTVNLVIDILFDKLDQL